MKKSKWHARAAVFIFAALILLGGCSGPPADNSGGVSVNTTAESETAPDTETTNSRPEYIPDLPDADFEGVTVTFLVKGSTHGNWESKEIYPGERSGETVNDAIHNRNDYLSEKYNFEIKINGVQDIAAEAKATVLSGDNAYDVVMPNMLQSATLAKEGYLIDLFTAPYIDLTKPWWDHNSVRDLSVANKLHFVTGEIGYQDNDATWVTMFNKTMAEDFGIEDPYQLVRDGKWTTDKLIELASDVTSDLDGDGSFGFDDLWGMVTNYTTVNSMIYAADMKIVEKDEDDLPYLAFDNEKISSILEKAIHLMEYDNISFVIGHFPGLGYDAETMRQVFGNDRALFYGEVLMHVKTMRWSDVTFGVLPFPKYDEDTDGYRHFIHATAAMVTIPETTSDLDRTAFVLEAMAAESMNMLTPAYYDVALTAKFMRDNESAEMLDLIIDSRVYDLGHIFEWGGISAGFVSLVQNKSTDFASMYAKNSVRAEAEMAKYLKDIAEIEK